MKKFLLSVAFAGILAINAKSQGLYFNLGAGYGFKAGSQNYEISSNSDGSIKYVNGSAGAGFVPTLGAGYFFNKNLGAELNFGYLFGNTITIIDKVQTTYNIGPGTGNNIIIRPGTTKIRTHSFYINPSFVFRANGDSKFVPYGKFGIFLGLANNTTNKEKLVNNDYENITIKGGVATGITTALGIDFKFSENLVFFGELTSRLASLSSKKYSISSVFNNQQFAQDGNFVKSLPANDNIDYLTSPGPLSSLGVNIGIRYGFYFPKNYNKTKPSLITTASSQGLYFNLGTGYGFKAGSQNIGVSSNNNGTAKNVNGSYGAGFLPTLGVGYLFNKNLGAELNVGYLFGKTITIIDKVSTIYTFGTGTTKISTHSFILNPSFVFRANGDSKIVPYGKFGIFLGLANNANGINNTFIINTNLKGGVVTGITTALGIDFKFSENLVFYGELNSRLASWNPKKYSNTIVISNTTYTQEGNFVKSLPANDKNDHLSSPNSFSSIGFNVGIRYCLFK